MVGREYRSSDGWFIRYDSNGLHVLKKSHAFINIPIITNAHTRFRYHEDSAFTEVDGHATIYVNMDTVLLLYPIQKNRDGTYILNQFIRPSDNYNDIIHLSTIHVPSEAGKLVLQIIQAVHTQTALPAGGEVIGNVPLVPGLEEGNALPPEGRMNNVTNNDPHNLNAPNTENPVAFGGRRRKTRKVRKNRKN
jgi:hypothetical protein